MTDDVDGRGDLDPSRFAEVRRLSEEAFDLPPGERGAYLDAACAGDSALRREIQEILDHDDGLDMSQVVQSEISSAARQIGDFSGTRIGSFRVVRLLGAGGMGTVYEAEQDEPKRLVALKTLGAGLMDPDSVSRFRFESEILAKLDHRNVASIFEAGTHQISSGDGSIAIPYFAMEYVKDAKPVTDYAREGRLEFRERLRLMDAICAAVHHGHLNGVIHRDLKPANILVNDKGEPKVIDFGVARASAIDGSMRTRTGELVGTLQYMSPEQVEGRVDEIDARSDVFALGAVMFELLCGEPPHDLADRSMSEVIRRVSDHPARRLRSLDPTLPVELDWITGKALRTERDLRYASAEDLRQDVERYLSHQPVTAGPPSAWYHTKKWVRRHRLAVAFAATLLVTMVTGLVVVSMSLSREQQARQRDESSREFLSSILGAVSPNQHGVDVRVVDMLDEAAMRLEEDPPSDALVAADVHYALGDAYRNLGRYVESELHLRRAHEIRTAELSSDDPERIVTTAEFAKVLPMNRKFEEADPLFRWAIDGLTAHYGESSIQVLDAYTTLAHNLSMQRREDAAREITLRMAELHRPDLKRPSYAMLRAQEGLAQLWEKEGDLDRSRHAYESMVALRAAISGVMHPAISTDSGFVSLGVEAPFHEDSGLAVDVLLEVIQELDQSASPASNRALTDTLKEASNFGHYFLDWGNPERARDLFFALLAPAEHLQGPDGDIVGNARLGLGKSLLAMENPAEAVEQMRIVYQTRLRLIGRENWQTFSARWYLIEALGRSGQFEELADELALAIEDVEFGFPTSPLPEGDLRCRRAGVLRRLDRDEEAERELIAAYEANQAADRKDHNAIWPVIELTRLYREQGRDEELELWTERIPEEIRKEPKGSGSP